MTRKDFVVIAETIATLPVTDAQRWTIAGRFALKLATTNPTFDRGRFMAAACPNEA